MPKKQKTSHRIKSIHAWVAFWTMKLACVRVKKKNDKILHKFSLLWTSRNKLAWCLHLLLCGHRWTDTPHPVQSPVAYSFLLQTHSPGEKHEQLNEIKIQTCEKPIERQQKCSPRCLKVRCLWRQRSCNNLI